MSVYNDFMDKLRIAGLGDGDFVEDFKGKNAGNVATSEGPENAPSNEQRRDSDVESDSKLLLLFSGHYVVSFLL